MTNASEYRNLPLASLTESANNPRRSFDEAALNELADFVPGHKSGLLFRRPFCGRGRREPHGNRRFPLVIGT
jgi:ParB family chromosome partitioning protein